MRKNNMTETYAEQEDFLKLKNDFYIETIDTGERIVWKYDINNQKWCSLNIIKNIDAEVVWDSKCGLIYIIEIKNGYLYVETESNKWKVMKILEDEYIIDFSCSNNVLVLKIGHDINDKQIARVYLLELDHKMYYQINNTMVTDAIKIPYIVNLRNENILILEDAKYSSYELADICKLFDKEEARNHILYTKLEVAMNQLKIGSDIKWNVLETGDYRNSVELLGDNGESLILAYINWKEQNTIIKYKTIDEKTVKCIEMPNCITFRNSIYDEVFISWGNIIGIYDSTGNFICNINSADFCEEIELNEILAVYEGKKVVFSATRSEDDAGVDICIVFDIKNDTFECYEKNLFMYDSIKQ